MINVRPLIEQRLRAEIPAFKEVAGAAGLSSILQGRIADPGCYVFQERSTAENSDLVGATMQRVTLLVAVITVVRNVRDSRGADAADASSEFQDSIQTALLGWQPHESADPMEFVAGALVSFANGFLIWKDTYKTYQFIRSI
jgi:hypothetical protein